MRYSLDNDTYKIAGWDHDWKSYKNWMRMHWTNRTK
jgi:hypothetical protein